MHQILPRPMPTLHPLWHFLTLQWIQFASMLDVVNLVRRLGVSQSVSLEYVDCNSYVTSYPSAPTTISRVSVTGEKWEALLTLIASRKVGDAEYNLLARDVALIRKVLGRLMEQSRGLRLASAAYRYEVIESTGIAGHACECPSATSGWQWP